MKARFSNMLSKRGSSADKTLAHKKKKRKGSKENIWFATLLLLVFLLAAAFRIMLAYQTETLDMEAYLVLRQAEHITSTGHPLFNDPMSYQGRQTLSAPLFHYFVAFLLFFFPPIIIGKVIMNLVAASAVLLVYFIVRSLVKDKRAALLCAFFAGFVPAYVSSTLNNLSSHTLVVPLFLLIVYLLINIKKKRHAAYLILALIVFVFTHPIIYALLLAFAIYILLQRTELLSLSRADMELLFFMTFSILWLNFLLYKKAFLMHGFSIIWQNTPSELLATHFTDIGFLQAIYLVGFIPLLLGVFGAYHSLFKQKTRAYLLVISLGIAFFLLLSFKLLSITSGFLFLSLILIILSSCTLERIFSYMERVKYRLALPLTMLIITSFFITTSIFQDITISYENRHNSPTKGDIEALIWLKNNSRQGATVLAPIEEGHMITYYAQRKNVADSNYLLIQNIDTRYQDIEDVFRQRLQTRALGILDKYDVEYIFLSERYLDRGMTPPFLEDSACFEPVYDGPQKIYRIKCEIV